MHTSVCLEEALVYLDPAPGKCIVDGTLGFGGHAGRILEKLGPEGKLIGFDKDPEALSQAKRTLERFGERVMIMQDDFKNIGGRLKEAGVSRVDGMLLDLGVSSAQLDSAQRGFSFRQDGPLDMRMNPADTLTAREIVNRYPRKKIEEILWVLGEERYGRRIAERIERERGRRRIETTGELASIISQAVPSAYRHGRIHPATRSFQALRMVVNGELEALQKFLSDAPDFLASGGRLVILSFHSLEDRQVKSAFRRYQKEGIGKILTKKPVRPGPAELERNPRARSAKLRAFEKSAGQNS